MCANYREHPEAYPLDAAPYAGEIAPHWRYATAAEAAASAARLYESYLRYKEQENFVGMDVTRRLLRLASRRAGALPVEPAPPAGEPLMPTAAAIFSKTFRMVDNDPDYAAMRRAHVERYGTG